MEAAIMHYRYTEGHVFPESLPLPDQDTPCIRAVREIFSFPLEVVQEVDRYLAEIRIVFGVDFSEDEEFVDSLHSFFHHLWKNSLIFYQHRDLLEIKRNLTAEYELAWLYQGFAPDFIGRFLCENELSNLVLCFSGAIRHYLFVHPERKLRTVLFSHIFTHNPTIVPLVPEKG